MARRVYFAFFVPFRVVRGPNALSLPLYHRNLLLHQPVQRTYQPIYSASSTESSAAGLARLAVRIYTTRAVMGYSFVMRGPVQPAAKPG